MRIIGTCAFASVGLLASADAVAQPWWIQGGALALLGGVLYWLLCKTLPGHAQEMKEERDASRVERADFKVSLDRMSDALTGLTHVIGRCPHNEEPDE